MGKNEEADALICPYLDSILDTLSDGVYLTDRDGKTLKVNSVYERLTGLTRDHCWAQLARTG